MAVWCDLDELKLWERNYNKGDVLQIKKSILRFGFNNALRVWRESTVMAGNHSTIALRECLADGWTATDDGIKLANGKLLRGGAVRVENGRVQVDTVDLSHLPKSEAEAFAIADNHIASKAEPDDLILSELLLDLKEYDLEILDDIGFTDLEFSDLLDGVRDAQEQPEDKGAQVDRADELREVWQTERGQLWIIPSKSGKGEHRLLCGDSTNADDVGRVMAGERARIVVTSPPYNQNLDTFRPWGMQKESPAFVQRMAGSYDDSLPEDEYQQQQIDLLEMLPRFMTPDGSIFYNHKIRYRDKAIVSPYQWLSKLSYPIRQEIIWDRGSSITMNARMFIPADERIYWLRVGADFVFNDDVEIKSWSTVWEIAARNELQISAAFANELPMRCIRAASNRGDVVLEPYCGSGTTMAVSEQLARLCCAIEREPKYIAVILQRMADMGLSPYKAD